MAQTIKIFAAGCAIAAGLALANNAFAAPDLATEMSLQLSRYMIATLHSSQGDAEAARQLNESTKRFNAVLDVASKGGQYHNCTYAPGSQTVQNEITNLSQAWGFYQRGNDIIQQNLQTTQNFVSTVKTINQNEKTLFELAIQASTLIAIDGNSAANNSESASLVGLTERLNSSATSILLRADMTVEMAFFLGRDMNQIRDILQALMDGSSTLHTTPVKSDARAILKDYKQVFTSTSDAIQLILANLQGELIVKQTITELDQRSDPLYIQIRAFSGRLPQGHDCH